MGIPHFVFLDSNGQPLAAAVGRLPREVLEGGRPFAWLLALVVLIAVTGSWISSSLSAKQRMWLHGVGKLMLLKRVSFLLLSAKDP